MCTAAAPASVGEALRMLRAGLALQRAAAGLLAAADTADLPAETLAAGLRELECADAAAAAVRGRRCSGNPLRRAQGGLPYADATLRAGPVVRPVADVRAFTCRRARGAGRDDHPDDH